MLMWFLSLGNKLSHTTSTIFPEVTSDIRADLIQFTETFWIYSTVFSLQVNIWAGSVLKKIIFAWNAQGI